MVQILVMMGLAGKDYPGFLRGTAGTTGLVILYTFFEHKYGFYMNNYVRAAMLVTLISDSLGGQYLEYYITSTVFDKVLHAFGTYVFSLFFYILTLQLLTYPLTRSFAFIFVFCLGTSFGTLYEIMEFIVDTTTKPSFPGQLSLYDTDMDLVADMCGAVAAATHAVLSHMDKNIIK